MVFLLKQISQLDQTNPVGGSSLDVVRQVQWVERHSDVASAELTSAIKQVQQARLQFKEMQLKGKAMKNGAIRQVQQAKLQDCKNPSLGHVAVIFGELEQDSFFESTTEPNDFLESKAPEVSQSENAKPSRKKRSKKSKLD